MSRSGWKFQSNASSVLRSLGAEEVLEQGRWTRSLPQSPGEQVVELGQGVGQSEKLEVPAESLGDGIGGGVAVLGCVLAASF